MKCFGNFLEISRQFPPGAGATIHECPRSRVPRHGSLACKWSWPPFQKLSSSRSRAGTQNSTRENPTSISLRSKFVLTSISLRFHFDVISITLWSHRDLTALPHPLLADFTSVSLRFHSDLTSISLRFHIDFTWDSLRSHFEFMSASLRSHFDSTLM